MNKQIALITCAWPPNGGGMGNNAYYLAKKMCEHGFLVSVFTPDYPKRTQMSADTSAEFLSVTFPIGKAGFLFGLFKRLQTYDIIHLEYPFFGTDMLVWCIKKMYPQKKMIVHYKMDPIGSGWKKIVFRIYVALFLRLVVRAADVVCILSRDHAMHSYLAPYLTRWPHKFVEVPNGVDTTLFVPQKKDAALVHTLQIQPNDFVVLFVGGLDVQHYFKGVDVLIDAFARLSIFHKKLVIVGDGNLRAVYQDRVTKLDLGQQVAFVGWIDNHVLPTYYALCDVLVLPSTDNTECFGIVVAEAMSCAKPTIVSNWPGVRATLLNGKTGFLVTPKDIEKLKDMLWYVHAHPHEMTQMGMSGRARVLEYYDWDSVIKTLRPLYE
jgi:glycosyltransferase involved in cell wall biosynthesis